MALAQVCKHLGIRYEEQEVEDEYVDGESSVTRNVEVQRFMCVLFLPVGDEEESNSRGGRQVRRPTLLTLPLDLEGSPVLLPPKAELGIIAAELNVAEGREADVEVRWQISGSGQPLGKPGKTPKTLQAILLRVED